MSSCDIHSLFNRLCSNHSQQNGLSHKGGIKLIASFKLSPFLSYGLQILEVLFLCDSYSLIHAFPLGLAFRNKFSVFLAKIKYILLFLFKLFPNIFVLHYIFLLNTLPSYTYCTALDGICAWRGHLAAPVLGETECLHER